MTKKIIGIVLVLLMTNYANAQVIDGLLDDNLYKTRIKLVDEFFDRFNGKEFRPDIKASSEDAELKNMLLLFNAGLFRSFQDSTFIEAKNFASSVLSDSIKINYSDSTWFAKAICHGKYKGAPVDFTLYLNVENRRSKFYKWVIAKAEGNIFKLIPSNEDEKIILLPNDHETNFMSLHRVTTEKDDLILNYKQKTFSIDQTTVFYALVYSGLLDIEYVKQLDFKFFQVPNYVFTVSHFERETYNAGWLISSLEKVSENEKGLFLNYIYNK